MKQNKTVSVSSGSFVWSAQMSMC